MEKFTLIGCDVQFGAELESLPARSWNQCLADAPAEFLVIVRSGKSLTPKGRESSVESLQSDPILQSILHFSPMAHDTLNAWQTYPHRLTALRENPVPQLEALILRVSAEPAFDDVPDPIWDFIIRRSANPGSIQVRPASGETHRDVPRPNLPGLAPAWPGPSRDWLFQSLADGVTKPEDLVPRVTSRPDAIALKAGLFQIHDYLDASHELSQSIEGEGRHRAGDYWHAIMHRREPDYSNSKYWFRRVGSHPIFEPLAKAADSILSDAPDAAVQKARQKLLAGGKWDPFAFVDFCEECCRGNDPEFTEIAERIQWQEMRLLLDQTYRDASE